MIPFGTQYYRSPFPEPLEWEDDFRRMRDCGLNTVKIWTIWGYLEPEPGRYDFGEIDGLFALAEKYGLKVQPNVLVEAQPFWIHRLHPGMEMVNHEGRVSEYGLRVESFVGVSPGGCFDHDVIRVRQEQFMEALAARYAGRESLLGWDAWNEMKWTDGALGMLCYCPGTIAQFREWLRRKYGSLEELGRRWKRRYCDWQDVQPPRGPWTGFIDMLDWRRFAAERMVARARSRYDALRRGDPTHPIMVHTGGSCVGYPTQSFFQGIDDWKISDAVDFYGTAYYPKIFIQDPTPYKCSMLLDAIRSAAGAKGYWISEMQGGQANRGLERFDISPEEQRFDIFSALAKGATGFLYWQWKHERQGIETAGFGMSEYGQETPQTRMAAVMSALLAKHTALLAGMKVPPSRVAVLYSPDAYILNWAADGQIQSFRGGTGKLFDLCFRSLLGYYRALWESHIPCDFIHADKVPEAIGNYDAVILPYAFYLKKATAAALAAFVREGGAVISDPFLGRMDEDCVSSVVTPGQGLDQVFGAREVETLQLDRQKRIEHANGMTGTFYRNVLAPAGHGQSLVDYKEGGTAVVRGRHGQGATLYFGSLVGVAHLDEGNAAFRELVVQFLAEQGISPLCDATVPADCEVRYLQSSGRRLVFCLNHGAETRVTLKLPLALTPTTAQDLIEGTGVPVAGENGVVVLTNISVRPKDVRLILVEGCENS